MKDVTPQSMRCWPAACPAIYELEDGHIIIGKMMISTLPPEIAACVGPDELAVWVPKGLVVPGPGKE